MASLNTPTRRGILGAMAVAPAGAACRTVSLAPAPTADWDRALAAFKAARRRLSEACKIQSDAEGRYYAMMEKVAKPRHGLVIRPGDTIEQAAAKDREEREAYERADKAAEIAAGLSAAVALNDAACDVDDNALDVLVETPAPTLTALVEKMQVIDDNRLADMGMRTVIDDLKRLAATEGR